MLLYTSLSENPRNKIIAREGPRSSPDSESAQRERDEAILPAMSRLDFFSSFVEIRAIRGPRSFVLELFCDRSLSVSSGRIIDLPREPKPVNLSLYPNWGVLCGQN